ncbi:hypothetical protein, partial [Morganella morganii]|uniref:hypothetical protein n=1 Tax=Morganella morganii TaxID=582 RepID=UPI003B42AD25
SKCFITVNVGMVLAIRCHRQNMKTSIINGSEVSKLSVAIHLSCVTESDFNSDKNIHGVVMIEVNRQTKVLDMQQLKPYQMVEILSRE